MSLVYGVLVLGRTGLRWGETPTMQVQDFAEVPMLHVIRNQPEGVDIKAPKSGKSQRPYPRLPRAGDQPIHRGQSTDRSAVH